MQIMLAVLISKFPASWQGIFGAMADPNQPLLGAEHWYAHNTDTQFGAALNWGHFMPSLCEEEPMSVGDQLLFKPRILLLPVDLQRLTLTFVYHHREDIPMVYLKSLTETLTIQHLSDSWLCALRTLLQKYIAVESKQSTEDHIYKFTEVSAVVAENICKQIKSTSAIEPRNPWNGPLPMCKQEHTDMDTSVPAGYEVYTPEFSISSQTTTLQQSSERAAAIPASSGEEVQQPTCHLYGVHTQLSQHSSQHLLLQTEAAKLRECWHSGNTGQQVPEEIQLFNSCTAQQMKEVCSFLDLSSLSEVAMAMACEHFTKLSPEPSYSNSITFAETCIYPKVVGLTQTASRVLLGTVSSFTLQFPKQASQAVLLPTATSPAIEPCHADLVTKVVKEAYSPAQKKQFFRDLLHQISMMSEPLITIIQMLLQTKTELDEDTLTQMVTVLDQHSINQANNLQFAKLLQAIVSKYGKQLQSQHQAVLDQMLHCNKTFLKKSVQAALKRLQ